MTVHVTNLSKKYQIQRKLSLENDTLKEKLTSGLSNLFSKKRQEKANQTESFWALKDISFSLNQGDRLAIIGKNGAGKSTLLKIMSRITPPTEGRIEIKDKVASLLEIGTGFHPELTGKENIFLNGALLGMSKVEIKKKFDEIVDFSEIELFLDTPVKRYSSGMFVRLAFAVAAHLESDVLIVDEALAVGDTQFKMKCISKLEEIGKSGRTIIFVTHDMWALRFCNKGILLEKGQMIPTRDLNECIAKYNGSVPNSTHTSVWSGYFETESMIIHHFELIRKPQQKGKILIQLTLLHQTVDLFVGFIILNQHGNQMVHHKISHEEGVQLVLNPGSYEFESEIDTELFSDGTYRIELDIGFHDCKRISHSGIYITFEIERPHKKYGAPMNTILTGWKGNFQQIHSLISK